MLLRSSYVSPIKGGRGASPEERGHIPFGIVNFRFQIVHLRFEIPSVARTRWPSKQKTIDRAKKDRTEMSRGMSRV